MALAAGDAADVGTVYLQLAGNAAIEATQRLHIAVDYRDFIFLFFHVSSSVNWVSKSLMRRQKSMVVLGSKCSVTPSSLKSLLFPTSGSVGANPPERLMHPTDSQGVGCVTPTKLVWAVTKIVCTANRTI